MLAANRNWKRQNRVATVRENLGRNSGRDAQRQSPKILKGNDRDRSRGKDTLEA